MLIRQSPSGHVPSRPAPGLNLAQTTYSTSNCPYINLVRGTDHAWSPATWNDTNGWLENVPNGTSGIFKYVLIHVQYPVDYVKPGNYIITWSGPLTVTITGAGSVVSSQPNRIVYNLSDGGEGAGALTQALNRGIFIQVNVANTSGASASLTDLAVYHEDDEADHLAGKILSTAFLSGLRGASILRVMDWMKTNDSNITNYSDIPTEAACSWATPCPPIAVIGKLIAETKADLWICMHHKMTQSCMDSIMQELYTQFGSVNNRIYVEFSNEIWNSIFTQDTYLSDTKAPALPNYPTCIVDGNGDVSVGPDAGHARACATAHGSMQAWTAAETYFPRHRVVRVLCGQASVFNALSPAFEYSDLSNTLFGGAQLKTLVDVYGISAYFGVSSLASGKFGVPTDMTRKTMVQRQDHLRDDSFWTAAVECDLDALRGYIASSKSGCTGKRDDIKLASYELGQGWELRLASDSGNWNTRNWGATVDLANNVLDFGADVSGVFTNGDQILYSWGGGGPLFTGGLYFQQYPVRFFPASNSKLRVYPNQAAYDADSGNTGATAATLNAGDGTWRIDNYTRLDALRARYAALLDSKTGAEWYRRYYSMCTEEGLTTFMQFYDAAGYLALGYGQQNTFWWGMKRSVWEPDTNYARAAWFRQFARGT